MQYSALVYHLTWTYTTSWYRLCTYATSLSHTVPCDTVSHCFTVICIGIPPHRNLVPLRHVVTAHHGGGSGRRNDCRRWNSAKMETERSYVKYWWTKRISCLQGNATQQPVLLFYSADGVTAPHRAASETEVHRTRLFHTGSGASLRRFAVQYKSYSSWGRTSLSVTKVHRTEINRKLASCSRESIYSLIKT